MLGKLFKHEFIQDSKVMVPSYIVVLILSVISRFLTWISTRKFFVDDSPMAFRRVIYVLSSGISVLFTLAFIALVILSLFYMVYRFYKNFFTDEGYLMLTLPTKPRHLVFSKFLNAIVWTLFSILIALLSFYVSVGHIDVVQDKFQAIGETFKVFLDTQGGLIENQLGTSFQVFVVELIIFALIIFSRFIISWYFAIAFGQLIFKDHKVFGAIFAYFILDIISKMLSGIYMLFITKQLPSMLPAVAASSGQALQATMIGNGILSIIVSVVLYFVICNIMTKKLNLD